MTIQRRIVRAGFTLTASRAYSSISSGPTDVSARMARAACTTLWVIAWGDAPQVLAAADVTKRGPNSDEDQCVEFWNSTLLRPAFVDPQTLRDCVAMWSCA
jgi:hypothetical protein